MLELYSGSTTKVSYPVEQVVLKQIDDFTEIGRVPGQFAAITRDREYGPDLSELESRLAAIETRRPNDSSQP